ncbi:hypothetical protein GEMRC1_004725 [Eukaryota sp. GEM-RC1]
MDQSRIAHFHIELRNSSFPPSRTSSENTPNDELSMLLQNIEATTAHQLSSSENFLFLSVNQSTSPCNHIVLNIGFNDEVAQKLALVTDPLFVYQCYRLFIETYSSVVFGVSPQDLSDIAEEIGLAESSKNDLTKLKMLIDGYQNLLQFLNHVIPQDPREQLSLYVQKVSENLPTDPIQLKVQCLLINDIHQPAITIDPSTKSFVTCEHGFDQNDTLIQSNTGTTSDEKLDRITKDLNAKAESIEDVVLFIRAEPKVEYSSSAFAQFKSKFMVKRNTGIAAAACLVLVILSVLLFVFLRSSSKTFLVSGTVGNDSVELADVLVSGDGFVSVYSNADGFFELQPLVNGIYELTFELAGYDTKSVNVTVSDSDNSINVSLSLNTFVVSGSITSDSVELADVLVSSDGFVSVYSNADGFFELQPLVNGLYEVTFELAGYDTKSVNVTVSDSNELIDVSLSLNTFVVSGSITSNSVELADVLVSGDGFVSVYSNADGFFELQPLVNGIYELTFELAGYDTKSVNVTVSDSNELIDVSLSLNTFVVSGSITSNSVELADVLVSGDGFVSVYSNADGFFELQPLVNGIYELTFELAGYDTKSVNVTVSDSNELIDVSLSISVFVVSGTVTSDSFALENVVVSVDGDFVLTTDDVGRYELELTNADYEIKFELGGFVTKFISVTVSGNDQIIDVSLEPLFTLELYIYDDVTSEALFNPRVKINQDLIVNGDETGHITVDLIAGHYELTLMHPDFFDQTLTVHLDSSRTESVLMTRHAFSVDGDTITSYDDSFGPDVVIPSSVNGIQITTIGAGVFESKQLTSVHIPNSVTSINSNAFRNNLINEVVIPDSVTNIGESAFKNSGLITLTLSESLTFIRSSVFEGNQITSVVIPNGVTSIGSYAFRNNHLSSVVLSESLVQIYAGAFEGNSLTNIVIPSSVTTISLTAFRSNQLISVEFGHSLESISAQAFHGNSNLE